MNLIKASYSKWFLAVFLENTPYFPEVKLQILSLPKLHPSWDQQRVVVGLLNTVVLKEDIFSIGKQAHMLDIQKRKGGKLFAVIT